jgi:hypothetical protein
LAVCNKVLARRLVEMVPKCLDVVTDVTSHVSMKIICFEPRPT